MGCKFSTNFKITNLNLRHLHNLEHCNNKVGTERLLLCIITQCSCLTGLLIKNRVLNSTLLLLEENEGNQEAKDDQDDEDDQDDDGCEEHFLG